MVRVARLLLHVAGWLLTPIAAILAASLGAFLVTLLVGRLTPASGVLAAFAGALVGGAIGLWFWLRLLRGSKELRDVLAVTPEGVPTEASIAEVLGEDPPQDRESPTS